MSVLCGDNFPSNLAPFSRWTGLSGDDPLPGRGDTGPQPANSGSCLVGETRILDVLSVASKRILQVEPSIPYGAGRGITHATGIEASAVSADHAAAPVLELLIGSPKQRLPTHQGIGLWLGGASKGMIVMRPGETRGLRPLGAGERTWRLNSSCVHRLHVAEYGVLCSGALDRGGAREKAGIVSQPDSRTKAGASAACAFRRFRTERRTASQTRVPRSTIKMAT